MTVLLRLQELQRKGEGGWKDGVFASFFGEDRECVTQSRKKKYEKQKKEHLLLKEMVNVVHGFLCGLKGVTEFSKQSPT